MKPLLTTSAESHEWTLAGFEITQVIAEPSGVRFTVWQLDGTAEIRLSCAFAFADADRGTVRIEPESPEQLAPLLALVGIQLNHVTVQRSGSLRLTFGDSSTIEIEPDPSYEAWEAHGTGSLAKLAYLCGPGGGSPWGRGVT